MTKTEFDAIDALEEACRNATLDETIQICNTVITEAERIKEQAEDELGSLEDSEEK